MKVLLITFYDPTDLGIQYIASYLKNRAHDVMTINMKIQQAPVIIDIPTEEETKNTFQCVNGSIVPQGLLANSSITRQEFHLLGENIAAFSPDLVGIGTRSKNHHLIPKTVTIIRKNAPQAVIVAGGAGPTVNPMVPLEAGVDIVIRGEGEYAFDELLNSLRTQKDWRSGHNLAWLENGKLKTTSLLPMEKNLDIFSTKYFEPERHILIENDRVYNFTEKNTPRGINSHIAFYLATRGCPADCSYCAGRIIRNVYKKENIPAPRMRKKSLNKVLPELEHLIKRRDTHFINFCDEYFIYPDQQLIDFFSGYREKIALPFSMNLSVDQLAHNPALLDAAFEAGLAELWIGLQAGSEEFCKKLYNRKNNNENILKVIHRWTEKGLNTHLFMIAGNPLETEHNIGETLDFLGKLPPFDPSFKSFIHFRTSKLFVPKDTALADIFSLVKKTCTCSEFYYQAMMIALRTILDDKEFNKLRNNKEYVESPYLLGQFYHDTLKNKHTAYLINKLNELYGKKVLIWGQGKVYKEKIREILHYVEPSSIVIDDRYRSKDSCEGSAINPQEALEKYGSDIPIIACGKISHLSLMHHNIKKHGFRGDIISCSNIASL